MTDFTEKADQLLYELAWNSAVMNCYLAARRGGASDLVMAQIAKVVDECPTLKKEAK